MDTQRDYEDVLRLQIAEGLSELERPPAGQFLSALSCGLTLGLGTFALFLMGTLATGAFGAPIPRFLESIGYTVGFVLVIMSRTELFTEHTTLAVLPVLDRSASLSQLGRLWGLVYLGNQIGITLFASFLVVLGPALDVINTRLFVDVAMVFVELSAVGMFVGAVLAGWLMALLAWILTSVGDTISRIVVIFLITFLIGVGHLPHIIATNGEIVVGMLAGADVSIVEWLRFVVLTTIGNVIGGVVFVALLNYSHVVRGAGDLDSGTDA
jgi:formate/nitrite transporter FocA (FNT family)